MAFFARESPPEAYCGAFAPFRLFLLTGFCFPFFGRLVFFPMRFCAKTVIFV